MLLFEIMLYLGWWQVLCISLPFLGMMYPVFCVLFFYTYTTPNGSEILQKSIVRDLGVNISSNLCWSPHINLIADGARKMTAWALSVFSDRSKDTMLTVYKTMIRSWIEYACPLWNPTKIEDIQTLEAIQRSFTSRIIECEDSDYWDRLQFLKILSLQRRRERYSIILMFKILNNFTPND